MMFGHDFYHGTLRRYILMFGNLFNEIQVDRRDANGEKIQSLNVPIEYGPKQKFITRVLTDPTLNREISITIPRLGFEFTNLTYAGQRKLNSAHRIVKGINTGGTDFDYTYTPVPYDMDFTLNVFVKNTEDGHQIVEQIIPFFTPDFTVTMKVLPELGITMDVPIELTTINSEDSYEGDFESRRVQTWDLNFTVKGYLFGPLNKFKYVTNAEVNTGFFIENSIVNTQTFSGDESFTITETTNGI